MNEKTQKIIRQSYGYALSALTVILGALFIWQVLDIYFSGHAEGYTGSVYSREIAGAHFSVIAPAFWLWVAMIAAGAVLWIVFPEKAQIKPYSDSIYALNRLKKRIIAADYGEELNPSYVELKRGELIIKMMWACVIAFCAAGAIYSIVYLATPANFPKEDTTAEVLNMVKNVFPFAGVAIVLGCTVMIFSSVWAKKQLPAAKKLSAAARNAKPLESEKSDLQNLLGKVKYVTGHIYFKRGVQIVLGCLGIAFVISGIFNESMHSVLIKAINICTECIGLG